MSAICQVAASSDSERLLHRANRSTMRVLRRDPPFGRLHFSRRRAHCGTIVTSSDDTRDSGRSARLAARRAPPPAARLGRADAERARRRPVLEGVRLADRARQDAADARDGRVARARGSASTRRSSRAASRATSARAPRRSSTRAEALVRAPRLRRRDRRVHRRARGRRRHRRGRAPGARALGRGMGPRAPRRGQARDRPARAGARRSSRARRSPISTAPRCSSASASAAT